MAAGSRLPRSSHGIFSPFANFLNTSYLSVPSFVLEQAVGPGVLHQHLCCNATINKNNNKFIVIYFTMLKSGKWSKKCITPHIKI